MHLNDLDPLQLHPEATQLGLSLYAKSHYPDYDDLIQDNIATQFLAYPDERKADLYALLAEAIEPGMKLGQMTKVASDCLFKNAKHFGVPY